MTKGRVWDDPVFEYEDPYSHRTVRRLTDYLGHSNHFYFTDLGVFHDGRRRAYGYGHKRRFDASGFEIAPAPTPDPVAISTDGRTVTDMERRAP